MNCTNCGIELKLEFDRPMRRHDDWTIQYDRALAVSIAGGYGMFFDQMTTREQDMTAMLCHDCAHAFVRANPWLQKLLEKEIEGPIPEGRTADEFGHMHEGTNFGRDGHGHN